MFPDLICANLRNLWPNACNRMDQNRSAHSYAR